MGAWSVTDKILARLPAPCLRHDQQRLGGTVLVALVYWLVYLRYSD